MAGGARAAGPCRQTRSRLRTRTAAAPKAAAAQAVITTRAGPAASMPSAPGPPRTPPGASPAIRTSGEDTESVSQQRNDGRCDRRTEPRGHVVPRTGGAAVHAAEDDVVALGDIQEGA